LLELSKHVMCIFWCQCGQSSFGGLESLLHCEHGLQTCL